MRAFAAASGEDALGGVHPTDVLGGSLEAYQDDLPALCLPCLGFVRLKDHHPGGGPGRGGQALADDRPLDGLIENGMKQLVEIFRIHAEQCRGTVDQLLGRHVDGDLHRRRGGALAGAGLQHPQAAVLDGELQVLHVPVVALELAADPPELPVGPGLYLLETCERLRRADPGHHVLALGVDQKLPVQGLLSRGRIAREGHPGGAVLAHVAVDHGLHVHRRAPVVGDAFQLAVADRPVAVPGAEDGADGSLELLGGVLGEAALEAALDEGLELAHQLLEVGGGELAVQLDSPRFLLFLEQHLEGTRLLLVFGAQAQHHVAVHLHEAAVHVVGEAGVAGALDETGRDAVVDAQVQDGVHHSRHGDPGPGAHREQERVGGVAETAAHGLLHRGHGGVDLPLQLGGVLAAVVVVPGADLGADGEPGGHGQLQAGHLRQVGALAAEELPLRGVALGAGGAELVHVLDGRVPLALGHSIRSGLGVVRGPLRSAPERGRGLGRRAEG